MTRARLIRLTGAAIGGAVCAGVLLAVTAAVGAETPDGALLLSDWVLPLLAGVAVACVGWVLMDSSAPERDAETGLGANARCTSCGGAIHGDWRLCPHCGERLAPLGRPFPGR